VAILIEFEAERRLQKHGRGTGGPGLGRAGHRVKRRPALATPLKAAIQLGRWLLVGFIHGVMNSDNMSLAGETIDYGPCAFINEYDPGKVFSSIDRQGRYAYGNQSQIATWNLSRFAETLLPLIDDDQKQAAQRAETSSKDFRTGSTPPTSTGCGKSSGFQPLKMTI